MHIEQYALCKDSSQKFRDQRTGQHIGDLMIKKQCKQNTQVERVIDGANDWFDSKSNKKRPEIR